MLIAFANNQTLACIGVGPVVVATDPVPLDGNDRLAAVSNVHAINDTGGGAQLIYQSQVSNDGGQNWSNAGVTDTLSATGLARQVGAVVGPLVRFLYTFSNPSAVGAEVSFVTFDLHVNLDHA